MKALLCAALAIGFGQLASATPELELVSGSSDTGAITGSGSTVTYSNANFNGWDILIVLGDSNAPGLSPYGLDVLSLSATCANISPGCASTSLNLFVTDTGFTQAVAAGGFINGYSATDTGSGASTSQTAWDDTTNTAFGQGSLIGTVGPYNGVGTFPGSANGSVSGGSAAGPSAYSLTIEDVFTAGGTSASFSTDGNITAAAVPEPAAISLLGGVLLLLGSRLRKRLG